MPFKARNAAFSVELTKKNQQTTTELRPCDDLLAKIIDLMSSE